jgi:uncharacterized protein
MQMVERPWGIVAYGAASVRAAPDVVRVRFKVVRTELTPSRSFAAVSKAVRAVRAVLRVQQIPDSDVDQSQLDLKSQWSLATERKFLGYQCTASFAARSANLDVQQLLIDLVGAGANEIDGVDFDVIDKPLLRADARHKAVSAARTKAELYAEAAGVRVGALLHVEDADPDQAGVDRYRGHSGDGEAAPEDLAPGQVVVSAAVILGFAIAPQVHHQGR